jgi:hypothetical protein
VSIDTAIAAFLFLCVLLATLAAWLVGPQMLAALRRARVRRQPFPPAWRDVLRRRMPAFAHGCLPTCSCR